MSASKLSRTLDLAGIQLDNESYSGLAESILGT